ncbi:lysophospholipid acyltransferase family protein [Granulicoccus phenolivorans]|uniref:lysophospholipid acyltransferase family protein n=1 Tax=Granulicoccus phenolivorans TaxID=266854 RepID=UPI000417E3A7|nr:lysophospholipid acyltransferase family protein [Granulicoccus phenolivorans]
MTSLDVRFASSPDISDWVPGALPSTDHLPAPRIGLLSRLRGPAAWALEQYWDIDCRGAEHIPGQGPVILASNHIGVADGPLLVARTPRPTFALAKAELFSGAVGATLEAVGQIPVARDYVDTTAIRRAVKVLREGHALAIFPEGRRHRGDLSVIQGGVAYLAMVTGAPIVPVAILGTRLPGQSVSQAPARGARLHIVYGEPIVTDPVLWPRRRTAVAEHTEQVRVRLAAHLAYAEASTGHTLPGPVDLP